jgi:hypothetical protein
MSEYLEFIINDNGISLSNDNQTIRVKRKYDPTPAKPRNWN